MTGQRDAQKQAGRVQESGSLWVVSEALTRTAPEQGQHKCQEDARYNHPLSSLQPLPQMLCHSMEGHLVSDSCPLPWGQRVASLDVPAQHFRETVEMVQGGHHIWALKGTGCAGGGPYVLPAQHALILHLAEGTWGTSLDEKKRGNRGAGKGNPCGVGQQAVCGERGAGQTAEMCLGSWPRVALHLGQNWGSTAVAVLRDVAR